MSSMWTENYGDGSGEVSFLCACDGTYSLCLILFPRGRRDKRGQVGSLGYPFKYIILILLPADPLENSIGYRNAFCRMGDSQER